MIKSYGGNIDDLKNIENLFDNFYKLIEKKDFEQAEKILFALEKILGKNNLDVFRARNVIRFMK